MNWRAVWNRLRGTSPGHEADLDDELAFHLEMKERDLRNAGLGTDEARLEARRTMGNLTLAREEARDAWTFEWLRDTLRDLRFGARTLAAQPAFTVTAVLALVLGIGVNATVFSVYNTLALAPWAIRDADRTVQVLALRGKQNWGGVSWPHYRYLRANAKSASGIAAFTNTGVRITWGEVSWQGMAVTTSDNFFDLFGTGFVQGRGFSPETNFNDPPPEIVLQYDAWMSHFGGDAGVVGQWIELNGRQLQIVGIAAQGFAGPSPNIPELWITGGWRDILQPGLNTIDNPNSCCVSMLARLNSGVDRLQAQAELHTLTRQFLSSVQDREEEAILLTRPSMMANPSQLSKVAPIFIAVGVASLLVLLLACANVANLQIARSLARRREIAVRLSLGASRFRIVRQLLTESLLLSAAASAASLALVAWLPGAILRMMAPPGERLSFTFSNDVRVYGFVLALTLVTSLLLGLAPAVGAVRDAVAAGLRDGGRATSGGRLKTLLLGAQVALCATLLSGATLLVRALDTAHRMEPGFRYADVALLAPNINSSGATDAQARGLLAPLIDRIAGLPGVVSVAHTTTPPLGNSFDGSSVEDPKTKRRVGFGFMMVSANFFETLGVPLVMGRGFTPADEIRLDGILVSEALAQRLWPDENPLGKTMAVAGANPAVVGVVRNFNTRNLGPVPELQVFVPGKGTRSSYLLIRYDGSNSSVGRDLLLSELPKLAKSIDSRMLAAAAPLERNVDNARRAARVSAAVAGSLSGLALLLACVGIYGVAAYNVSQRTREIGVRMALGARAGEILRMILGQNLRTVLVGAAAGIGGAVMLGSLLASLLYGVKPADPLAMSAAFAILLATATLSTLAPASKAAAVDPSVTLRHD